MFGTIYSAAGLAVCCIILGLAIWRGGPTEQAAAGATALAWGAALAVQTWVFAYAWGILGIDTALLVFFGVLFWRSSKEWPLAALAFQGVIVAADIWYLVDRSISIPLFIIATAVSSFGVLASIVFGIWQTAVRRMRPTES